MSNAQIQDAQPSQYQRRYWAVLSELRWQVYYCQGYVAQELRRDWWVSVILALTSSGSVASWVIWEELRWVWVAIISGSQLLTILRPFLPFSKRAKALGSFVGSLQDFALNAERRWYEVAEGLLTDKEIHDIAIALQDGVLKSEQRAFDGMVLPENNELKQAAEKKGLEYLRQRYGV